MGNKLSKNHFTEPWYLLAYHIHCVLSIFELRKSIHNTNRNGSQINQLPFLFHNNLLFEQIEF